MFFLNSYSYENAAPGLTGHGSVCLGTVQQEMLLLFQAFTLGGDDDECFACVIFDAFCASSIALSKANSVSSFFHASANSGSYIDSLISFCRSQGTGSNGSFICASNSSCVISDRLNFYSSFAMKDQEVARFFSGAFYGQHSTSPVPVRLSCCSTLFSSVIYSQSNAMFQKYKRNVTNCFIPFQKNNFIWEYAA